MHWRNGVANDGAIPVPVYMVSQRPMPSLAYRHAIDALSAANPKDGIAAIAAAEAALRAGLPRGEVISRVRKGLTAEPASARGWLVLAEALTPTNKRMAAEALSQSLMLAPHEFWLAGPQSVDAAALWPDLDGDTQQAALRNARQLWDYPPLREHFFAVADTPGAASVLNRAFSADEIRYINRWGLLHEMGRAP
ncbi:hypothetical protein GCM10008941_37300 [Rhizomicrobium palustre]